MIDKLGAQVAGGTREGTRYASLDGFYSQSGCGAAHGCKPMGGWRFGNTIDGCQAEHVRVPDAMANLAPAPDSRRPHL